MTRVLSIAGVLATTLIMLAGCRGPAEQSPEEGPEQPIAFYHSVHAGENQIPCAYCHYTAEDSRSAGIPAVATCVGCHSPGSSAVPPEQAQLAFPAADRNEFWHAEATKLIEYWQRQEAIPWVRVHRLPEHVKFPHNMHIQAGLQCQTCHGPVEEMEEVYRFSSLQMGWCISCHTGEMELSPEEEAAVRERSSYVREVAALGAAGADVRGVTATWPNMRASIDCFVCHY
jgi:hypothetical protein